MPLSVIGALFVCIFITACGPPRPLFGIRRLSTIRVLLSYYIYGDVSRCMYQRPLFGRCPLLGVSVNRDSTVYSVPPYCVIIIIIIIIIIMITLGK